MSKLSEFYGTGSSHGSFSAVNCDDVFRDIRRAKIDKVEVTDDEMHFIVLYFLANTGDTTGQTLREGKLDRFWGVDLQLI